MLPPLGFPSLSMLFLEHNCIWKEPIWVLYSTGHTFESFFFLLSSFSRSFSLWFMDLETSFNYIPRTAAWSDAHQEWDRCSVQPPWVLHSNMLHGVTINTQCEGHSSCCHAVWVWMCSDLLVHAHRLRHAHTLAHIFSLLHSQYTRVTLARGILGSEYSTEGNHFGCNAWKHLQCWQIRAHLFPLAFLLRDEWWWCKSATMQTGLPTFTLGSVLHAPWSSVWGWTPMFCKALPKLQSEVGLPVAVWGPGRDCQQSGLTGCSIFHLPGGAGGANLQPAHLKTVL